MYCWVTETSKNALRNQRTAQRRIRQQAQAPQNARLNTRARRLHAHAWGPRNYRRQWPARRRALTMASRLAQNAHRPSRVRCGNRSSPGSDLLSTRQATRLWSAGKPASRAETRPHASRSRRIRADRGRALAAARVRRRSPARGASSRQDLTQRRSAPPRHRRGSTTNWGTQQPVLTTRSDEDQSSRRQWRNGARTWPLPECCGRDCFTAARPGMREPAAADLGSGHSRSGRQWAVQGRTVGSSECGSTPAAFFVLAA